MQPDNEHLARAAWAFDRMLDHVGTAMCPEQNDPDQVAEYARIMDEALAAYRAEQSTDRDE